MPRFPTSIFLLLLASVPAAVNAQFAYLVTNNTVWVVGYSGPGGLVIIPSDVNGVQVTGIGDNALLNNTNITEIKIPDSVTNIGQMAFESCPSLRYITCGKGVAQIGPYAFANCNFLSTASFKGNAPTVDSTAFNNDTNVTVYYLPGTTGWGPSLANIPAVLWNPGIGGLRIISNFNYMGEGVVLSITNTAVLFTLETSTNLLNPWLPTVGPFSGTGPLTVFFPGLSNYPTRFFRLNMP